MPGQASENYFLISDVRKPYSSYPQHCKKREKVRVPAAWSSAIQNVLGCMSRVPAGSHRTLRASVRRGAGRLPKNLGLHHQVSHSGSFFEPEKCPDWCRILCMGNKDL